MELASAIASDLSGICEDVFSIQIVPPGRINFELTHSALATWLQSLVVGSCWGAGEQGEINSKFKIQNSKLYPYREASYAQRLIEKKNIDRDEGTRIITHAQCPMPNDATCSTWGDPKTAVAPQCPVPNSLFAIEYAHARCCSLVLLAHREGLIKLREPIPNTSPAFWDVIFPNPLPWLNCDGTLQLNHPDERRLIGELIQVVDNIECPDVSDSVKWEKLALNLSQAFEKFWSNCRIWGEVKITSPELAQARLGLLMATQSVLKFVLEENLGVFAPLEL
ncbi:MAG: DALR anticodon-binding domain-containing protein [Nostoc sp. DedQUE08]|uniref:DALR anticodon-binding domain-containing protein n=1 Tax=unclassified Nostoc TaxID=2593658 RepID=UPI002AD24898|nr:MULTISPECIES: DALR anticodon-binding domain-containing protein [unclassified Nostoc]MDZ8030005.1 DALR anticodon-binding domain-containing protein [Nostoc sp. DedSLP04]MDZ8065019.1 DALR anticodon-binding domain-containing protein [Nostoc sp. DedQUE08]MDZ8091672.1 DALR anticodon-binding domain-containing protein [Nostoc sp. DedQUE05]